MTPPSYITSNRNLLILIILVSGIILYLPSLSVPFLNDEIAFIKRNTAENLSELAGLFDKKDYDGYYYRPVPNLVSGVVTYFAGYSTQYYRIFNLLIHTFNGILVFVFVTLMLNDNEKKHITAFFGSLFFIAFPLNDYAVIWHTDLFDRLMMMFYFLSLIFYLKKGSPGVLSLIFFLLAALSKEMAFSLPVIIYLLSFYKSGDRKTYNAFSEMLPYIIVFAVVFLFRWLAFGNNIFDLQDAHSTGTLLTALKNLFIFSGMLVFPFFLRDVQDLLSVHTLLVLTVAAVISAVFFWLIIRFKRKDLLFFILIITVAVSIVPASRLLMRWYLYLPSAFFSVLLAYIFFSSKNTVLRAIIIACLIFGIYYSFTLHNQTKWIAVADSGQRIILNFVEENDELIKTKDKVIFLTIPAKVNDIPLFQLGFDHHLNHFLEKERKIFVSSKSSLSDINDFIKTKVSGDTISIMQHGDNYFILSGIEKNVKFNIADISGEKLRKVYYIKEKEPDRVLFTFSEGKFHLIKD